MGLFDFLFGNSSGYNRLVGWSTRNIGPLSKEMSDGQIAVYVSSLSRTPGSKISTKTLEGFTKYLKNKHGQKQ